MILFLFLQKRLSKTFETILYYPFSTSPDNDKSKSFATYAKGNGRLK